MHGADLVELEPFSVQADSCLFKEDRSGGFLFDLRPDDRDNDQGKEAADEAAKDIHQALQGQLERGSVVRGGGQDIVAADLLNKALAAHAGNRQADMNRQRHFTALLDELSNTDFFVLSFRLFLLFCFLFLCAVSIVDEVFHRFIAAGLQIAQVLRIDEDFIHTLPADIIGSIAEVGDHLHAVDGFPLRVAVAQDNAGILKPIQVVRFLQDFFDGILVRHEDHGGLILVPVQAADQQLPEDADGVADDQMEAGCQIKRDTGIGVAGLGGEEVQGHDQQDQHNMLDGFDQFLQVAALDHIVHGVEQDGYQDIHNHQDYGQRFIVRPKVGPLPPPVAHHVA